MLPSLLRLLARVLGLIVLATPLPSVVAGAAATERYVALGDSYSSGTGTNSYAGSPSCERGRFAYPALVARRRPQLELAFAACVAATTDDVLATQVQRLDEQTRWVTITIGGNDAGFAEVIGGCASASSSCGAAIDRARRRIREALPARLDAVYREIRSRAPAATVIVLGYPRLFTGENCNAATSFSRPALRRLNTTADLLRDTIRERVKAAGRGFRFRDAIGPFGGHAVCSRRPWINGLTSPLGDSFHPNRAGHSRGYAPLVLREID